MTFPVPTMPIDRIETTFGPLSIARATGADLDTVMAISLDAADWIRTTQGFDMWGWLRTPRGREVIQNRIGDHELYIATSNANPVATLCLQWSDSDFWGERGHDEQAGYVHGLAVAKSWKGRGVGSMFLNWAEQRIASRGRKLFRLDCMGTNSNLRAYYEKQGFKYIGLKEGRGWSSALYEREIPSR